MALPGQASVDPEYLAPAQEAKRLTAGKFQNLNASALKTRIMQRKGDTVKGAGGFSTGPQIDAYLKPQENPLDRGSDFAARQQVVAEDIATMDDPSTQQARLDAMRRLQAQQAKLAAEAQARGEQDYSANVNVTGGGSGGGNGGAGVNLPAGVEGDRAKVLAAAKSLLGTPYLWGGGHGSKVGPTYGSAHGYTGRGIDCSGLTAFAFDAIGRNIKGTTWTQKPWAAAHGKPAPRNKLVPGDIVFNSSTKHVAIFWGLDKKGNQMVIEAPHTGAKVRIAMRNDMTVGYHLNY